MKKAFQKAQLALSIALTALVLLAGLPAGSAAARQAAKHGPARGHAGQTTADSRAAASLPAPQLPVTGASLFFAGGTEPLWSLHGSSQLPIASTTKLMTALVVLQHVRRLGTIFTQTNWRPAPDDSQIGLVPGERMSVHDLLVALLLPSADDAALDLAYNVGHGSVRAFVAMMNRDARALGLHHTHYANPIGFDAPGNYSSPDDLDRLADYMMRHWPFFRRTVALPTAVLRTGRYVRHIVNTNDLLIRDRWIDGVKTGHTSGAGYVLIAEGRRDGLTLLASVLGTTTEANRDASALGLLDWGFAEFRWVDAVRRGQLFARRAVAYEAAPALIVAARGYATALPRGARVRLVVGALRPLQPPLARGTVVGDLHVVLPGRSTVRIPLVLARTLPPVSLMTKLEHFLKEPFTLLVLALLLVGAAVVARRSRRRPRVVALRRVEDR